MEPIPIQIRAEDTPTRRTVPEEFPDLNNATLAYTSEGGEPAPVDLNGPGQGCCGAVEDPAQADYTPYTEVVFKGERRGYYKNNTGVELQPTMYVIVEAEKGIDIGMVNSTGSLAYMKSRLHSKPCNNDMRSIVRIAEEIDRKAMRDHRAQEPAAFQFCLARITRLNLPMKLVDVEYQLDRNRITFYFTAEGRVDFRELVKELASEYRTRIELRQIGPRDEARRLGGVGNCGREICCSTWLSEFEPISTGMARIQNLTMNPFKLAGQCGRLKCCIAFESQVYEELIKRFPPLDATIKTKKGVGRIEKIDVFQDVAYVYYEKADAWDRLTLEEIKQFPVLGA